MRDVGAPQNAESFARPRAGVADGALLVPGPPRCLLSAAPGAAHSCSFHTRALPSLADTNACEYGTLRAIALPGSILSCYGLAREPGAWMSVDPQVLLRTYAAKAVLRKKLAQISFHEKSRRLPTSGRRERRGARRPRERHAGRAKGLRRRARGLARSRRGPHRAHAAPRALGRGRRDHRRRGVRVVLRLDAGADIDAPWRSEIRRSQPAHQPTLAQRGWP